MLRALIFDFDGLILDTETPEYKSWQAIYHEFDLELDIATWGQFVGGNGASDFHPVTHLEKLLGKPVDGRALNERAHREHLEQISQQSSLPGVIALLEHARQLRLGLAVASSSSHHWVDGHLKRLGLFQWFDHTVCRDDVPAGRTKPHPDLFLFAAEKLGVSPQEALIFEDSPNGVLAARRAGIRVVGVPNPITAQLQGMDQANWVLPSLDAFSLEQAHTWF